MNSKRKLLKIMIFSPTHSSFYSLKFSIFPLTFVLFFLRKLFSISLHHFQTQIQKRNYLSLKFIIFICLKYIYIYLYIYIYFKLYICNFLKSCKMPPSICPCPLESVITFYFIFGKHKYILFLITKVFVVVIFFLSPRQVEALFR